MTGETASSKDFNDTMKSHAPLVFAFVLSAAFLLLLVTFRSLVIPIKAIVLNLLSVGAAYGVLVWIFQYGHLESLLDFKSTGSITSWMPLFLFVVLFGLSMDYHVFILSRIREAFDRGNSTEEAVEHGIKSTAGVVTSAAVVMVSVFAIFATLSLLIFKQLGVGLAVAVLIDATLVRGVLLPATMKLLGDWNWYLPKWLEWLPHVGPETGGDFPRTPLGRSPRRTPPNGHHSRGPSSAALRSAAMSSLLILSIACIARLARSGSGSVEQLLHPAGHHLPGEAVLVLQPAARPLLAARGQPLPVVVDVLLGLAVDLEGDSLVELELGAAVDADEPLALQLELHGHNHPGRSRRGLGVVRDVHDARILEDGNVEGSGLLGFGVEPQVRDDLLQHGDASFPWAEDSIPHL